METSLCTMAQATYDDDGIDELHAQLGPFGCGRTGCCVCIGMGIITIGLPLIIARFYRNPALVKLRADAGGAQKTF